MNREEMNALIGMTEEEMDVRAAEYENDTWDSSHLGRLIIGRPSIADEDVSPVTFRLPVSKIAELDRRATENGHTRSEELRAMVDSWLASA